MNHQHETSKRRRRNAFIPLRLGGLFAAGTLTAFALTRTPQGLFNFQEPCLQPAPQALIALVAEIGVLAVVGAWLVADHVVQRPVRTVSTVRL